MKDRCSPRSDGSKVTYLGREDFDGTLAYKLKVTQKDGDEFVYWLDPDTYLEIKVDETRRIRGAAADHRDRAWRL